jgi:hypothetical protein
VVKRIKMILSAYRKDEFADPDAFILQVAALLQTFPREVVDYVSSPITGVQRHVKFPPNLADIAEACDERMAQLRAEYERAKPSAPEPVMDRSGRPTYEEMRAKFGPTWGLRTIGDEIGTES